MDFEASSISINPWEFFFRGGNMWALGVDILAWGECTLKKEMQNFPMLAGNIPQLAMQPTHGQVFLAVLPHSYVRKFGDVRGKHKILLPKYQTSLNRTSSPKTVWTTWRSDSTVSESLIVKLCNLLNLGSLGRLFLSLTREDLGPLLKVELVES